MTGTWLAGHRWQEIDPTVLADAESASLDELEAAADILDRARKEARENRSE